jgi:PPK2 family polyphosphate:nucleotide phosphotransferase
MGGIALKRLRESRLRKEFTRYRIRRGEGLDVNALDTRVPDGIVDPSEVRELLTKGIERLAELQDKLYAHNRHSLLIILQAMDAAGKDGAIKHMLSGLNPQGVTVSAFKQPSRDELDHDFLWRHAKALPPRGEIGIFNRSYYEHVLLYKVHTELVLQENLPDVHHRSDVDEAFWNRRLAVIRRFEQNLIDTGTSVIKFYLHISYDEQRKRLLSRIDDPHKNWKFSADDIHERQFWSQYMSAYSQAIAATSTVHAPWYVIPADDKWYARLSMSAIIHNHMESLKLSYPSLGKGAKARLADAREILLSELE